MNKAPVTLTGDLPRSHGVLTFLFLERDEITIQNAMFLRGKKTSVGVFTAIIAIAQRSCCDCTAFTLRLLAI
jgi:hypothetical protein